MRRLCPTALLAVGVVAAAGQLPAPRRAFSPPPAAAFRKTPKPYDEPAKAWEFYAKKRAPVGQTAIPTERYVAARKRMSTMRRYSTRMGRYLPRPRAGLTAAAGALGTWSPLGPGNIGGRTRALLIDPGTPTTMYAAGVAGGVWKTTNGGGSWAPLDDFMANLAVNAMAMDPGNSSVLYAGTGEGFFNVDGVRGAGIFKTTNGGTNWTALPNTVNANFHYVNDVIVSTNDSQRVYAATRTGVWRSTNGGVNWTQIMTTILIGGCFDLLQRPGGPADEIFASCGTFNASGDGGAVVRRSANAEAAGPVFSTVLNELLMGRTSLAIAPSNPNVLYALSASDDTGSANYYLGLHAVFRSTDGGLNWTARVRNNDSTKLNTLLLTNPVIASLFECGFGPSNSFSNQGWYDNVIAVDPADPARVWVGGIDLFRSDDGGANWGLASHWWLNTDPAYAHADQHRIAFHPGYDGTTNQVMFVGSDGGVFRTDNARAAVATGLLATCDPANTSVAWTERNNNYGVTQFYYGVPYPGGTTYFGGTQDNGTVRGTDGGGIDGWAEINDGDGGAVAVDPGNTNILYSEHFNLSIQKSTNGGSSWADAVSGINTGVDQGFLFIVPFLMDPGNAQRLWTGGWYMWRTADGAVSWNRASAILPGTGSLSAVAVSPADANYVLAGMDDGVIARTTIGLSSGPGDNWPGVQPRTGYVAGLGFHPTDRLTAYATYSTFGGVPPVHVFKTIDGGATWTDADGSGATGIPDIPCHSVVVDPSNPNRVYVGTDLGVFVSTDAGATWAVENTGFANVVTESLSRQGNNLFAFTHGRGAWKVSAVAPTLSIDDVALAEGDTGSTNAVFTVTLSEVWSVEVKVDFNTAPNTALAGLDYTTTTGTVTIPAGSLTGTISVPVLGDLIDEPDESFFVNLTNPQGGATILDAQGEGTIQDDDPVPAVSIDDVAVVEGNAGPVTASFTVSLSNPSSMDIQVPFATANASAIAPGDYQATSGAVFFSAGVMTLPISITVNGDTAPEPDETYFVNLEPPTGPGPAVLADFQGVGSIGNDDPFPADDVRFFTIRATSGTNVLEWVNPLGPYVSTVVHKTTATSAPNCVFPTNPTLPATFVADVPGTADTYGTYVDTAVTDGTTYCYTAFVKKDLTPTFSPGKNAAARPFVTTGPVKWAYTTAATAVTAPGLSPTAVYAVSNDRVVHAMSRGVLDPAGTWPTGPPDWRPFALGGPAQSRAPIVPGSPPRLLLGSQDGFAYAVDAVAGTLVWQTPAALGDDVQAAPAALLTAFGAPFDVVLVGGRTPGVDNLFYGLNAATGANLWPPYAGVVGDRIGIVNGGASVDYSPPQRVYFASRERGPGQSTLWCLNVTAGGLTLQWKRALGDIDGSPVLRNGVVYVGTNTGVVHALDADDGDPRWSFPTGDGPIKGFVFPDRADQDLYFSTTTKVWGLVDNVGSAVKKWVELTGIPSPSIPFHAPGSNLVLVGGGDGALYQIDDALAGNPAPVPIVTSVPLGLGNAAVGAPTYDSTNDVIYVGTTAGIVYAVKLPIP